MNKETQQEKEEREMAEKILPLIKKLERESLELDLTRGKGVTLKKSETIGDRQREIEKELSQLKINNNE